MKEVDNLPNCPVGVPSPGPEVYLTEFNVFHCWRGKNSIIKGA